MPSLQCNQIERGWWEAHGGVNGLQHPQETKEGGLDQKALRTMQEEWQATQESQYTWLLLF